MKHTHNSRSFHATPVLLLAVLAFAAAGASAQSDEVLALDIEPQDAGSALVRLARSWGTQIMLKGGAAKVEVEGLQGEYRLEEALAVLLTDTGLTYEFTSENVVLVQAVEEDAEPEQEEEAEDDSAVEEEEEPMELAPQTVTGSRLLGGDPSTRLFSFTAEDIAQRGVSTVEEFFRKLPFAFASLTTQTGAEAGGPFGQARGEELSIGVSGVGVSAINLRGLGVANTLVLMNGRRVAGTGGMEDDFTNLLNVPLSAIERVDIQLDGASAVYGSDAIGGVVNFITKNNYSGLSMTYRHEFSATDADKTNATITGGYAWGSGNMTVIMDRSTSEPINNEKAGWTSLDWRPYLGVEFDRRNSNISQPGIVCLPRRIARGGRLPPFWLCRNSTRYQLPPDQSGAGATVDDFLTFSSPETAPTPLDEIDPHNGAHYTTSSASLNVEQYLTGDLLVYANALYSRNESYQHRASLISDSFLVPASNAYNPFGQTVIVNYATVHERDNSLLPAQREGSENESRTLAAGVVWSIGDDHEVEVSANRSKSWREAYDLTVNIRNRSITDPTARAFFEALSSSDPARAINPFGNGMAQGSAIEDLLTDHRGPYVGTNETRQYNALLRGRLFRIWGGPITYSLGGEMRKFISYYSLRDNITKNWEGIDEPYMDISGSVVSSGVARRTRDTEAYYAEFALPFFGPDNERPGANSLILTLQARYDVDVVVGADGVGGGHSVGIRWHYWDPEEGFAFVETRAYQREPSAELAKVRNGDLTPRVGINYKPVPTLTLRASWRRSYKTPNWSSLFSRSRDSRWSTPYGYFPFLEHQVIDPFDPDGPTVLTGEENITYIFNRSPLDIESQYSDSWSVGFDWTPNAIPGLRWRVDWSKTDFTNRIIRNHDYLYETPTWILGHPQTGIRNERGDLVTVYNRSINIAADYNELITTDLEYTFDTRFGEFTPRIHYSRYLDDYHQVHADVPQVITLGTQNGMDEYKLQGSLTWLWDRFSADVYLYYTPNYVHDRGLYCNSYIISLPGSRCTPEHLSAYFPMRVSSLTTVDLTMTYQFDNGLRLRVGGTNILDRAAPRTITAGQPYDPTRWDARGRVFFLELNWEM